MSNEPGKNASSGWPLERVLFAMAGTVILLSILLVAVVSKWFLLLTGLVGVSQWMYATVGFCPTSLVLTRAFGLKAVCGKDAW